MPTASRLARESKHTFFCRFLTHRKKRWCQTFFRFFVRKGLAYAFATKHSRYVARALVRLVRLIFGKNIPFSMERIENSPEPGMFEIFSSVTERDDVESIGIHCK